MFKEKSVAAGAHGPLELSAIFTVQKGMIPDNGEDCYLCRNDSNRFIIAAFDGCGGSGSKKYECFSGKTGAYIASRAVAGALNAWFDSSEAEDKIDAYTEAAMNICKSVSESSGTKRMMGSLGKAFPTTAAIIVGEIDKAKGADITVIWAGDSRCYILSENGLCQLSEDDLDGQDAMSNLLNDGVMTNVISASVPYKLHRKKIRIGRKCVLLCATDGCFGFLPSPMHFEHLLVDSLTKSNSIYGWKEYLHEGFSAVAGDDYTLTVAAIGYNSFDELCGDFVKRLELLEEKYVYEGADVNNLWNEYKKNYYIPAKR